ncbi:MAG: hypothetical protein JW981_08525 [Anaerolineae bacterium]|nr:hypothetical protein [Anaerolineae bacterium]
MKILHKREDTQFRTGEDPMSEQLQVLAQVVPTPDARVRIWKQAQAKAAVQSPVSRARVFFFTRWYASPIVTFLCVILLAFSSVRGVVIAQTSLPGDPMYESKRVVESVWLATLPPEERIAAQFMLLDRRIDEVETLVTESRPVPRTAFLELESAFKTMGLYPARWYTSDIELSERLDTYEELLLTLAAKNRQVPQLREVARASFYARQAVVRMTRGLPADARVLP